VADAENELYNISLQGVQDYSSQYAETTQEMYEEMEKAREKYYSGEYTKEQYETEIQNIKEVYYNKLKFIASDYYQAIELMEGTSYNNTIDY